MAKKFIIADLNDEKSKDIAAVLGNKTSRKILDYLAENDATETQIAGALNLPASTVNYNIQRLLKANLIEAKDFYWSPKGNKVHIYKAARKLIVIAPKHARGYEALKSIIPIILIGILLSMIVYTNLIQRQQILTGEIAEQSKLKKFSSFDELKNFVRENSQGYYNYGGIRTLAKGAETTAPTAAAGAVAESAAQTAQAEDYSATNIQVAGVDEADIVKNDEKYIYIVSNNKIVIVDAFPAENAGIVSEINLSFSAENIFINKDKLIVLGQESNYYPLYATGATGVGVAEAKIGIMPPRIYSPKTEIIVYDISDRQNPTLEKNISIDGSYFNSRMIGSYIYAIINQPVYNYDNIILPRVATEDSIKETEASEIYYFDVPDDSYIFSTVAAINLDDLDEIATKVFMMGYTQNMYVSQDNIYITYMKRISNRYYYDKMIEVYISLVPQDTAEKIKEIKNSDETYDIKMQKIGQVVQDYSESLDAEARLNLQNNFNNEMEKVQEEIQKETEKTVIHKIAINKDKIEHKAVGEVAGFALNQFSMDEYNNYFRIATTTESWKENSKNNVYVLNKDLEITGKIEGLAEGERIYSARFIQDRAYMVTFRQIDPLFVINLENPENPAVLGYLKIPGVSDYLHPYDENHLIGIGRDATEEGRVTGMKLSLFDVSDFENPKEISKYIIGGRGTYSEALNEHKAFLFSKSKGILAIPVTIYEDWNYKWNGAYVFSLDLENGFMLKGTVTHENESKNKSEYNYADWQATIRRSLYMDDIFYTISQRMIKMNSLESENLAEINKVMLPYTEEYYPYRYAMTETMAV